MSSNNDDNPPDDKPEPPRDKQGRFAQKTETEYTVITQPKSSDYTKMNSIIAKQIGLTDKLADLQTEFGPQELFAKLSFMMEYGGTVNPPPKPGLPPNKNIVPPAPGSNERNDTIKIDNFKQTGPHVKKGTKQEFHGDLSLSRRIKSPS